ncbi:MAG: hypothetical protein HRT37_21425 [Alteromonadaceae bacterium]|nr:hypothetical protein [Alteromonadaceae bacterium]
MFELFLVMMAISSPILVIIFVQNYFKYKKEVNQKLFALQIENESIAFIATQKKLDILIERVIVLERIVTNSNINLSWEINHL